MVSHYEQRGLSEKTMPRHPSQWETETPSKAKANNELLMNPSPCLDATNDSPLYDDKQCFFKKGKCMTIKSS
jgi:hypothetical protein